MTIVVAAHSRNTNLKRVKLRTFDPSNEPATYVIVCRRVRECIGGDTTVA